MLSNSGYLSTFGSDAMPLRACLLLTGILLLPIYFISKAIYNLYFHPLSNIPGPRLWSISPLPFALAEASGFGHNRILQLHKKYGGIVRVEPNSVSVTDPTAWKDVYGHRKAGTLENSKHPDFFMDMPDSIIGSVNTEEHSRQRRILSHGFSAQTMVKQEPLIRKYVDLLLDKMNAFADQHEPIDVVDWYNYTTFDIIGDLAFGTPFGCLESAAYHSWVQMIFGGVKQKHILRQIQRAAPLLYSFLRPVLRKIFAKVVLEARNLTETKVHQRLALGSERPDFMQSMIGNDEARKMTMPQLYDNADILILAGSETTATAPRLSAITSLLCAHPRIRDKLRAEVDATFSREEDITLISVQQLKYMMVVIDEALRLYPAAAGSVPRSINPFGETVSGKYLPANTVAWVYHWVTYHNPDNFALPESFIPERWEGTDPRCVNDKKEAFQPFSHGARNCIGKNLAYAEMRLILARLLWNFEFELVDPKDKDWIYGQPMYGLWEKPPLKIRLSHRGKTTEKSVVANTIFGGFFEVAIRSKNSALFRLLLLNNVDKIYPKKDNRKVKGKKREYEALFLNLAVQMGDSVMAEELIQHRIGKGVRPYDLVLQSVCLGHAAVTKALLDYCYPMEERLNLDTLHEKDSSRDWANYSAKFFAKLHQSPSASVFEDGLEEACKHSDFDNVTAMLSSPFTNKSQTFVGPWNEFPFWRHEAYHKLDIYYPKLPIVVSIANRDLAILKLLIQNGINLPKFFESMIAVERERYLRKGLLYDEELDYENQTNYILNELPVVATLTLQSGFCRTIAGCGDLRYLDVEEIVPGAASELKETIMQNAAAVRQRVPTEDAVSSNLPTAPNQTHLTPMSHQRGQPVAEFPIEEHNVLRAPNAISKSQTSMLDNRALRIKYLIVCINTKRGLVIPRHLDVSSVTNDQYLFEAIRAAYSEIKREHQWSLATVFTTELDIPSWMLRLLWITQRRKARLPAWLDHWVQTSTLFVPKRAEFVQFQLLPVRKEILAGNMVKPEMPGDEEVLVKRTYEYKPIPLKVKIINIPFMHELLRPGLFWWNRFPKKLDGLLIWDENADCLGWGIHITEGWNMPFIVVLILITLGFFGVFIVADSIVTHDASAGDIKMPAIGPLVFPGLTNGREDSTSNTFTQVVFIMQDYKDRRAVAKFEAEKLKSELPAAPRRQFVFVYSELSSTANSRDLVSLAYESQSLIRTFGWIG
ncbi:Isotrichodermin C-15 hydroxylase [Paramyrothecium foliicola]|nr:Isotrichodermin C-15 hydroxylase [Paramyrothecium foliicola]